MRLYRKLAETTNAARSALKAARLNRQRGVRITGSYLGERAKVSVAPGAELVLDRAHLAAGVMIEVGPGASLRIEDSYLGFGTSIRVVEQVRIGAGCQIAEFVRIFDDRGQPVQVESNVWLASRVQLEPGAHVGADSVIGASAIARGKLQARALYVGSPAKKLKSI